MSTCLWWLRASRNCPLLAYSSRRRWSIILGVTSPIYHSSQLPSRPCRPRMPSGLLHVPKLRRATSARASTSYWVVVGTLWATGVDTGDAEAASGVRRGMGLRCAGSLAPRRNNEWYGVPTQGYRCQLTAHRQWRPAPHLSYRQSWLGAPHGAPRRGTTTPHIPPWHAVEKPAPGRPHPVTGRHRGARTPNGAPP